ncbi:MAG: hypothetical protein R2867_07470 [Caldilineaceae bacterium]
MIWKSIFLTYLAISCWRMPFHPLNLAALNAVLDTIAAAQSGVSGGAMSMPIPLAQQMG